MLHTKYQDARAYGFIEEDFFMFFSLNKPVIYMVFVCFNMLFTKFLLTQIMEILMATKLLHTRYLFGYKIFLE